MPKTRESLSTKTRDSTDDYEIILSENKSPKKSDYQSKEEFKNRDDENYDPAGRESKKGKKYHCKNR